MHYKIRCKFLTRFILQHKRFISVLNGRRRDGQARSQDFFVGEWGGGATEAKVDQTIEMKKKKNARGCSADLSRKNCLCTVWDNSNSQIL